MYATKYAKRISGGRERARGLMALEINSNTPSVFLFIVCINGVFVTNFEKSFEESLFPLCFCVVTSREAVAFCLQQNLRPVSNPLFAQAEPRLRFRTDNGEFGESSYLSRFTQFLLFVNYFLQYEKNIQKSPIAIRELPENTERVRRGWGLRSSVNRNVRKGVEGVFLSQSVRKTQNSWEKLFVPEKDI